MDGLALAFPITLVAYDVLKVFVALDVFAAHQIACIAYHLFWDAALAGNLYGKRTARTADFQLEERAHLVPVVEHRTIGHTVVVVGEMLQVLVMGGDDSPGLVLPQLPQHRLGDGAAYLRLRASAEFIDEQQGVGVRLPHHHLHVEQMAGVGAQVILYALLVADVDHDAMENAAMRAFAYRDGKAALEHVLQQPHRLEAYRLPPGVGTGDDEQALLLGEHDVERHHLLALA